MPTLVESQETTANDIVEKIKSEIQSIKNALDDKGGNLKQRLSQISTSQEKLSNLITKLEEEEEHVVSAESEEILDEIIRLLSSWGMTIIDNVHELKAQEKKALVDLME